MGQGPRSVGLAELHGDDFFTLQMERDRKLVVMRRTSASFKDLAQCEQVHSDVVQALERLGATRRALRLLVDLRAGPARNDPAFEAIMAKVRHRIFVGFGRCAVVVRTASGQMQVTRHMREDRMDVGVFVDEAAARKYLES